MENDLSAGSLAELLNDDPFRVERFHRRDRYPLRGPRYLREIVCGDIEDAASRGFRYHQRMTRRAGHDVQKSQRVPIFINLVAGDFSAKDFSEDILIVICRHGASPKERR